MVTYVTLTVFVGYWSSLLLTQYCLHTGRGSPQGTQNQHSWQQCHCPGTCNSWGIKQPWNTMPSMIDQRLIPCNKPHLGVQSAGRATSLCWGGNGCSTLWFGCWRPPVFSPDALRWCSVLGRRQRRYNLIVPDLDALNCCLALSCVAACHKPQISTVETW